MTYVRKIIDYINLFSTFALKFTNATMEIQEINKLSLGFQMGETFKMIGRLIAIEIPKHGVDITMEQFILLMAINRRTDTTQHELAQVFNKDKSAILRLTDELERKKLLVRMMDDQDRRKKTLMLTKKGVETLEKVEAIEATIHERMLTGVSNNELKVFSGVLNKIRINAGK